MIEKPEADEKVEGGWLRIWLIFEVLAGKADKGKDVLNNLIDKLDQDPRVKMYKKEFSDVKKIENPMPKVKEGFSLTCEIEFVTETFDKASQIVMEYGPSAIEILAPHRVELKIGEAQGILNSISQMMHRFAAAGVGGIVVAGKKE